MNRLVKDAMVAYERRREPSRRRIGSYEFREPDYSQILIWASAVGISPKELVAKLQDAEQFTVSDGAITVVQWMFEGIELDLSKVPDLEELYCDDSQLVELDLSRVPNLKTLWCNDSKLIELDLSRLLNLEQFNFGSFAIAKSGTIQLWRQSTHQTEPTVCSES